jgi:hypothetical protein
MWLEWWLAAVIPILELAAAGLIISDHREFPSKRGFSRISVFDSMNRSSSTSPLARLW